MPPKDRHSELRHDLVSGNWVLMAPGRGKRPHIIGKASRTKPTPIKGCPFENPFANTGPLLAIYGTRKHWSMVVVANKYPAVVHSGKPVAPERKNGFYEPLRGAGHHELLITRDHYKNFPKLTEREAEKLFEALQERYRVLAFEKDVAYISIFHNWGRMAGASVYHPHYQILTVPIIPADVEHTLRASEAYYKKHGRSIHDLLIRYELKKGKRIVFENDAAVALAPYVSPEPFELKIYPKRPSPCFEDASGAELAGMANALRASLKLIERKLDHPDYNFLIHTAPVKDKKKYRHYKWHIGVIPKLNIDAGFELGTGIEINTVDPNDAAKILRS